MLVKGDSNVPVGEHEGHSLVIHQHNRMQTIGYNFKVKILT